MIHPYHMSQRPIPKCHPSEFRGFECETGFYAGISERGGLRLMADIYDHICLDSNPAIGVLLYHDSFQCPDMENILECVLPNC